MKKSKYQQHFHCFIVCILVPYAFWFSFQQNIVTILMNAVYSGAELTRGEELIKGRGLFQCGYPKVRRLLQDGTYLMPGACQRKYGRCIVFIASSTISGARGEHLTIQLLWAIARLLITSVNPIYLVDEFQFLFLLFLSLRPIQQ